MIIEWKNIEGYDNLYQISNYGIVRRKHKCTDRRTKPFRILKNHIGLSHGYYYVALTKNGYSSKFLVHRLLAIYFINNPSQKQFVNHKDGNKLNINLDNLEWVTMTENNQHAIDIGLNNSRSINNPRALLNEAMLISIRGLISEGYKNKNIADIYDIDPSIISKIKSGKSYK